MKGKLINYRSEFEHHFIVTVFVLMSYVTFTHAALTTRYRTESL